jgi:anti-anti-sigma factor
MNESDPKVEKSGNVTILTFTGHATREIGNQIALELEGRTEGTEPCHLLLDFSNVDRIHSEELGTLIRVHQRLQVSGGRLTLFNLSPSVYEVFTVTQLHTLLRICRSDPLSADRRSRERVADRPFHPGNGASMTPAPPPHSVTRTPWVGNAPLTTDEGLRAIEQMAEQVNGYVQLIRRIDSLQGSSAEAKEKAVAAFHARLTALERQLGRICEEVQSG